MILSLTPQINTMNYFEFGNCFPFQWLKCVVNLQCDIAKHLVNTQSNKLMVPGCSPNPSETSPGIKSEPSVTNLPSTSAVNALAASLSSLSKDVLNGVKNELGAHSNATSNVANACISRVVTTTITTSSGGKTVTKPVTILYASPSKLQAQMNGPLSAAKGITPSSLSSQIAAMASSGALNNANTLTLKHEPTDVNHGEMNKNQIDTIKLINDLTHLNNLKPKSTVVKPAVGATTVSGSLSSNAGTKTATALGSAIVSALPGSTAGKLNTNTPTKLIVLSNSSGNILKTIGLASSTTAGQIPSASVLTLPTTVSAATTTAQSTSTSSTVLSSPVRGAQGAGATPLATANAINSICAATGVDAFNGELCCCTKHYGVHL